MRSLRAPKRPLNHEQNDFADWYVIGAFVVASFAVWLLVLSRGPY
jgi:hypothetical protein